MWTSRISVALLLAALVPSGCSESSGGAGGSGGSGGGGASPSTSGGGGGDEARIDAEREALDGCQLDRPCPPTNFMYVSGPTLEELTCVWTELASDEAAGRFVHNTYVDGPCCVDENPYESYFYVRAGTVYLWSDQGRLQRCSLEPPSFFQACLDAAEAGEPGDPACSQLFSAWVEGCVDAEPACP